MEGAKVLGEPRRLLERVHLLDDAHALLALAAREDKGTVRVGPRVLPQDPPHLLVHRDLLGLLPLRVLDQDEFSFKVQVIPRKLALPTGAALIFT